MEASDISHYLWACDTKWPELHEWDTSLSSPYMENSETHTYSCYFQLYALVWKGKKQANNKSVKRVVLLIRPVPFAQWVANTSKNMKTTMLICMVWHLINLWWSKSPGTFAIIYCSFHWPQLKKKCFIANLTVHLISVHLRTCSFLEP